MLSPSARVYEWLISSSPQLGCLSTWFTPWRPGLKDPLFVPRCTSAPRRMATNARPHGKFLAKAARETAISETAERKGAACEMAANQFWTEGRSWNAKRAQRKESEGIRKAQWEREGKQRCTKIKQRRQQRGGKGGGQNCPFLSVLPG